MTKKFMTGIRAKQAINPHFALEAEYILMTKGMLLENAFTLLRGIEKATIKYEFFTSNDTNELGEIVSPINFLELRGFVYTDKPLTETSIKFDASVDLAALI